MSVTLEEVNKRRAKRRKEIRKRRFIIGTIVFFVIAIAVMVVLSLTVLFPVETVTASGSAIYSEKQIIKASRINSEDNLFMLSENEVTELIRSSLPYVDSVKLNKKLPSSVSLKVTDAKEYACYTAKNGCYIVSEKGYVLAKTDVTPENLIDIVCAKKDIECEIGSKMIFKNTVTEARIEDITQLLEKEKLKINRVDVSDPISLSVRVCSRFDVLLGTSTDLDKKIAHLRGMVKSIDETKTGKINLSMWTSDNAQGSFVEGAIE